ncbi:MAG TPA: FtsQ-type POTRA domain-containing protein [Gaiellaceae bacterium]|nr:FtsQ-type POTRA domain-containing protein [Gaiellaceae bacterium]
MVGGRVERGSRRARAASVVVPFPRPAAGGRLDLARLAPSGRSLLAGFALVLACLGAYWGARDTSLFAVERVQLVGAPPDVAAEVRRALGPLEGSSLLALDADALEGAVRALPSVAGVAVDRAFPHTLVVKVAPERPVAVVRQRAAAWLVAASGTVIRPLERGTERHLPRLWVGRSAEIAVGRHLPSELLPATRALGALQEARLPRRVKAVRTAGDELTLVLRDGLEIRLGAPVDVGLKLAAAAAVFPLLAEGTRYLDVSVPERPVASRHLNS